MAVSETRTLEQIRRETEQTRSDLTRTVGELRSSVAETATEIRHRISPDNIKAEVSGYISSRKQQFVDNITSAARDNPIQAVAVGASLAYPLFRMVRAVPLPILMVGAGLFLAGSKTGQRATQRASDMTSDLSDAVSKRASEVSKRATEFREAAVDAANSFKAAASDQINRMSGSVSDTAYQASDRFSQKADDAMSSVNSTADAVGSTVSDGVSQTREAMASASDAISAASQRSIDAARNAAGFVREKASDLAHSGLKSAQDSARNIGQSAAELSDRTGRTVTQAIEGNPMLVAGLGLVIGGLIASALPRSETEDRLVGGASSALKNKAQEAANQGFEAAKDAAGEIYSNVARQAAAEGLTADGLDATVRDVGERIRHVAESAVTTAFDPDSQSSAKADGGRSHG